VPATSVIPEMLPLIQQLIDDEHAYVNDGWVYYRAASFPRLGELAHVAPAQLLELANEMGNNPDDPRKEEPLDFVLWQASAPDEPSWDSPWGKGRPGWHIECSTMATAYLGPQVDIHGGGTDLIFPHHACEIAQAEPITGVTPFVRYWMHVGLVGLDGTKMSKSLGNMVFVEELLKEHSPEAIRLYLLSTHYRGALEYDAATLGTTEDLVTLLRRSSDAQEPHAVDADRPLDATPYRERFLAALDDDLQTPAAIEALRDLAEAILAASARAQAVAPARAELGTLAGILGIRLAA
jgi:L-cysteine:1D-myo-inositol 2-amino-2-deoxy-alpha-D-glucopyranoside ligase